MMGHLTGNILKLYGIKISKWFMLFMPIVVVFYQDTGLSMQQIMLLKAAYAVATAALEIPSGYLADSLGRKYTLVLGTILGFAGFVMYSFAYGFYAFLAAELVLGVGGSLISGADSALLYDTLTAQKRPSAYTKYEGRMSAAGNFAEALAAVLGGFLAELSLRYPFYAQTVVAFAGIPFALWLKEPYRLLATKQNSLLAIWQTVNYSLVTHKILRGRILFSAVLGLSTLILAWMVQPYLKSLDVPLALFGILWTSLNLTVGVSSFFAHRVTRFLGPRAGLIIMFLLIPMGFLYLGLLQSLAGLVLLFVIYLGRGLATPVLKDYINQSTTAEVRATVLSVRNLVIRVLFALLSPLVGWLTDSYSLATALLGAGILLSLLALYPLVLTFRSLAGYRPE